MRLDEILADLDALPAGFAVWGEDRRLAFASRAFQEAFRLADSDVWPGLGHERYLKEAAGTNELVLATAPETWVAAEAATFGQERTVEQSMSDGRTLEVVQRPTERGGMVVMVQDVTARRRAERTLRRAKELAEATDQTKSRFLRAANHDLRQPLATLKILIYNCMSETDDGHRKDLLHTMDIAVAIMEDLLGALLQIGELDAGKIVPRITTFQVLPLLQRLELQFRHQAEEKGLRFQLIGARGSLNTDKALLERILSNFVANAVRYTEVGGILIGCRRAGQSLRIEVRDTGRGLSPEQIGRIFDEFYQVPDARRVKRAGLGLGLNIVRRLADLLGHPVEVRSRPGRGSVFAVTVPTGNVWHSDIGEPEISEMIGGEFAGLPVLLVEDDEVLRRATQALLERWGIVVHSVSGEAQAQELIAAQGLRPRLILADYSLRDQQGTMVVRNIWDLLGGRVPTIIVTADNEPGLIRRIKAAGFPVLIKPVSPPRLRVLMHNQLFEPDTGAGLEG